MPSLAVHGLFSWLAPINLRTEVITLIACFCPADRPPFDLFAFPSLWLSPPFISLRLFLSLSLLPPQWVCACQKFLFLGRAGEEKEKNKEPPFFLPEEFYCLDSRQAKKNESGTRANVENGIEMKSKGRESGREKREKASSVMHAGSNVEWNSMLLCCWPRITLPLRTATHTCTAEWRYKRSRT